MKSDSITMLKPGLAVLFLVCALLASACWSFWDQDNSLNQDSPDQDSPTEESFGYRFDPDEEFVRGRDDEPTFPSADSSTDEALVVGEPRQQRVERITPEPLPGERLPPPSSGGVGTLFDLDPRFIIILVVLVLIIASGIGVAING